jgi:hypothetical protein
LYLGKYSLYKTFKIKHLHRKDKALACSGLVYDSRILVPSFHISFVVHPVSHSLFRNAGSIRSSKAFLLFLSLFGGFNEKISSCCYIFISYSTLLQPFTDNKISPQLTLPRPDHNLHSPSEFLHLKWLGPYKRTKCVRCNALCDIWQLWYT